jgi:hypothetical protein
MELSVTDDGVGLTASRMKDRLKHVGSAPEHDARRGFFHRGIREVFLAMGGGRMISVGEDAGGRLVLSEAIFDPTRGMALQRSDTPVSDEDRRALGFDGTGTRVVVPLGRFARKKPRQYTFGAIEAQIRDCVQIRPVVADPDREVVFQFGGEQPRHLRFVYPDGVPLVQGKRVEVAGQHGTFWANVAERPIKSAGKSRQTRCNGILIRGARAAYEVTVGEKLRSHPAMARLFGELRIDSIEALQRQEDRAPDADEAQLVYKVDRSGLNPEHPLVEAIYQYIDTTLGPLIAGLDANEEKRPVSADMRRQLAKLARVINEVVQDQGAGDLADPGGSPKEETEHGEDDREPPIPPEDRLRTIDAPIDFAYDRIFIAAGQSRTIKVWFDGNLVPEGTAVEVQSAPDERVHSARLSSSSVPAPGADDIAELSLTIKAGGEDGRHEVLIAAGDYTAVLPVHVRFPRASGFITNIVLKDEDWEAGSALFDPSSGVVTVFIGRPEFKDAEARAQRQGYEPSKEPLYRQLVVESVREAALRPAAERAAEVEWDDLPKEERRDNRYAFHELVITAFNELDYKLRAALLKSFVTVD